MQTPPLTPAPRTIAAPPSSRKAPGIARLVLLALAVTVAPGALFAGQPCQVVLTGQSQVSLALDWKFAMGAHAEGKDPTFDDSLWPAATPPFRMTALPGGRSGEAWLRCHIVLAGARPDPFFLHLDRATDAFEVYFNGTLIGRRGSVSPFSLSSPGSVDISIPAPLWQEQNTLALRLFAAGPLSSVSPAPVLTQSESSRRWDRLDALALSVCALTALLALLWLLRGLVVRDVRGGLPVSLFALGLAASEAIRHGMRSEWFDTYAGSAVARGLLGIILPVLLLEAGLLRTESRRPRPLLWLELGAALAVAATAALLFVPPKIQAASLDAAPYAFLALLLVFSVLALRILSQAGALAAVRPFVPSLAIVGVAVVLDASAGAGLLPVPDLTIFTLPLLPATVLAGWRHGVHASSAEAASADRSSGRSSIRPTVRPTVDIILANVKADFSRRVAAAREFSRAKSTRTGNGQGGAGEPRDPLERWTQDAQILSEIQHGALEPRQTRFSIREHIEAVAAEATTSTGEKATRLQMFLPPPQERFWCDGRLVRSILFHLIENALLYSTGKIEVRAERTGNMLRLRVRDQGPGMSADLRDHAFDPFVRGSRKPGSGLGLTFVDRAVAHLGGRLHIESGEGFFTLVEMDIPEIQEGAA